MKRRKRISNKNAKAEVKMGYHKTDIHRGIIRNIALNIELLLNENDHEISEYDIQVFMATFLRRFLRNMDFIVHRESHGKYDCVIADKGSKRPVTLYELKSFIKVKERVLTYTALKQIEKDFKKLGSSKHEKVRRYFILACKRGEVVVRREIRGDLESRFEWLKDHYLDRRNHHQINIDDVKYKLRPSRKEKIGRTCVLSWEVEKG